MALIRVKGGDSSCSCGRCALELTNLLPLLLLLSALKVLRPDIISRKTLTHRLQEADDEDADADADAEDAFLFLEGGPCPARGGEPDSTICTLLSSRCDQRCLNPLMMLLSCAIRWRKESITTQQQATGRTQGPTVGSRLLSKQRQRRLHTSTSKRRWGSSAYFGILFGLCGLPISSSVLQYFRLLIGRLVTAVLLEISLHNSR